MKVSNISTYLVVLFQSGGSQIDRRLVRVLQQKLGSAITTPKENTRIDVCLHSPGGDAHAAYKLMLDMRSRAIRLQAIVPDYAKSAATLMLLGMDAIYMGAAAELGPLDVQIEHPDREGKIVSGLDLADSLEYLGKTAIELALTGGASMVQYTQLPRIDVLRATLDFLSRFLEPAVAKLDPHLIHRAASELRVAIHYATALLEARSLPADKTLSLHAESMVERLVKDYPSHGSIICRDEAEKLGLPIEKAEMYPAWNKIRELHSRFMDVGQPMVEVIDITPPSTPAVTSDFEAGADTNGANDEDHQQSAEQSEGNGKAEAAAEPASN